jgi:hypothetical protein
VLHFGQGEHALVVSLNAQFGLVASQAAEGFNSCPIFDLPEYFTYRYGARATKHAKHPLGVGMGGAIGSASFPCCFERPWPCSKAGTRPMTPTDFCASRLTCSPRPSTTMPLSRANGSAEHPGGYHLDWTVFLSN